MQIIPKVLFVGIGLIGGSFALALRKAGLAEEIMAIDCAQDNLIKAVETKVIDRAASWQDAKDADVIIIATPVAAVKSVLEKICITLLYSTNAIFSASAAPRKYGGISFS